MLPEPEALRVSVIGLSGSGKTTFAMALAEKAGLKYIELDLINWRPGWYARYMEEFDAFRADVETEIFDDRWVLSGGYSSVRPMILARANVVVWLDLPKWVVLRQVFLRSLHRAFDKTPILNGNHERITRWVKKDHPIQLVWRHYARKKKQFGDHLASDATRHLHVIRCQSREEVQTALETLVKHANRQMI